VTVILGYIFLVIIAFVGAKWSFYPSQIPVLRQQVFFTVTKYLIVGILLGPYFTNLLNTDMLVHLGPVLHLILGWIGFLIGIQFEWSKLKQFPARLFQATLIHGIVCALLIFLAFYFLWPYFGVSLLSPSEAALYLAAIGCCSTPTAIAIANRYFYPTSQFILFGKFVTSFVSVIGIILLTVWVGLFNTSQVGQIGLAAYEWVAISILLGTVFGFVFHSFNHVPHSYNEQLAFTIGVIIFASGVSIYMKLSPIFVTMVMGIVFANLSKKSDNIFNFLLYAERIVFIILLIIAGAIWQIDLEFGPLLALYYFVIRFLAKLASGYLSIAGNEHFDAIPKMNGLVFIPQGGIALALIISIQLFFPSGGINVIITAIYLAFILNEVAGGYFLNRALKKTEKTARVGQIYRA